MRTYDFVPKSYDTKVKQINVVKNIQIFLTAWFFWFIKIFAVIQAIVFARKKWQFLQNDFDVPNTLISWALARFNEKAPTMQRQLTLDFSSWN